MIFKIIFISIFSILLLYSFVRPFVSQFARWFLMIGSVLGILSILGVSYTQVIANYLGIGRGADLYLYLSLVTIFLFVAFTINRFDSLNKKISLLVKEIAILKKDNHQFTASKISSLFALYLLKDRDCFQLTELIFNLSEKYIFFEKID